MTKPAITAALLVAAILAFAISSAFAGQTVHTMPSRVSTFNTQPGYLFTNQWPGTFQQVTYGNNCQLPICPEIQQ